MFLTHHGISSLPTSGGGGGGGTAIIGGVEYRTVSMPDGNVWLAENLDYKFDGCIIGNMTQDYSVARAAYYNNDESTYGVNGKRYGLLYNWTAVDALNTNRATLMPGWHVATQEEWDNLVGLIGENPGPKLKSTTNWVLNGNGTDDYAFTVWPSGWWYDDNFAYDGYEAHFWTSTGSGTARGYSNTLYYSATGVYSDTNMRRAGYSVRLVQDT